MFTIGLLVADLQPASELSAWGQLGGLLVIVGAFLAAGKWLCEQHTAQITAIATKLSTSIEDLRNSVDRLRDDMSCRHAAAITRDKS